MKNMPAFVAIILKLLRQSESEFKFSSMPKVLTPGSKNHPPVNSIKLLTKAWATECNLQTQAPLVCILMIAAHKRIMKEMQITISTCLFRYLPNRSKSLLKILGSHLNIAFAMTLIDMKQRMISKASRQSTNKRQLSKATYFTVRSVSVIAELTQSSRETFRMLFNIIPQLPRTVAILFIEAPLKHRHFRTYQLYFFIFLQHRPSPVSSSSDSSSSSRKSSFSSSSSYSLALPSASASALSLQALRIASFFLSSAIWQNDTTERPPLKRIPKTIYKKCTPLDWPKSVTTRLVSIYSE